METGNGTASPVQRAHRLMRQGDYPAAREILERALAGEPESANLVHAWAHLLIDSGAFAEGAAALRPYLATHDPFEGVNVHIAWHLAYIELELGRPAATLDWHRRVVAPTLCPMAFYPAVSLLWRLEVAGHGGPGIRPDWAELHRAAGTLDESPSLLERLAVAMTAIATGDGETLEALRVGLRGAAERKGEDATGATVLLPLVEGLDAYWRGDLAGAAGRMAPLVPRFGALSEYPDQLSALHDTLRAAQAGSAPAGADAARG